MTDLADTRHLHIEFKHEPLRNMDRSKKEGRPIFEDQEVVVIKFVGDRRKELVAPAREKFTRDRATGEWMSYAQAFPKHYEAFLNGRSALLDGTPLSEAAFLKPAQVKEFEALNLHTVEQLAAVEGTALQRLGMYGRDHKNKAIDYLESSKDRAVEYRLKQENDDLRRRIEVLETMAGKRDAPEGGAPATFADWSDADLKAFIKEETGQAPRGTPARETLIQLARDAAQHPAKQVA
ncbi:MAG: hypothetical protein AB7F09_20040 [Parvibaculaceae bacterium]